MAAADEMKRHFADILWRRRSPGIRMEPFLMKTAIASSTKGPLVRKHLERTGLSGYFQEIVSGDMVEKSKPEPDIYLKACEAVGVLPENAMGIEDSFNGIRAVAAAGMTAVMVPDMVQPDEKIRQIYDYCVQDLLEVKELIELLA